MMTKPVIHHLEEKAPTPFDFESTAKAHGWVALHPFAWHESTATLSRVHQLRSGQVVVLQMQAGDQTVQIQVEAGQSLEPVEALEIRQAVRRMLRLDENLTEFYDLHARMNGHWRLDLQPGGGRLLRCPTLFEDIIYTLCTTNINWSGTKRMVEQLTTKLGRSFPGSEQQIAFPTPTEIAAAAPEFLKEETGLGYRTPYVWELAVAVAENRLDLSQFEDPELPSEEVYNQLKQIKGVGPYAAATILMLLDRYEYLAVDSEMRAFVSKKYFAGERPTNAQIQNIYAPWGAWRYLAYWFDAPPS